MQPTLSALQKCAHLLRDLAATVDLPPHSSLFSLQLLDLAHRWSEREDNDIDIFDVLPLAAVVYIQIKLNSALAPDPDPFPDPQQPARPLADLLTAITRLLARRQLHNAAHGRRGQSSKSSLRSIASWTTSTTSLPLTRRQLGSKSPNSAFPCGVSIHNSSSRNARSSRWYLPMCLLTVRKVLLKHTFGTSPSQWTPGPVM